jgi:IS605 OrfB family transposase
MADATPLPTTQRAYTLRLRSAPIPEEHVLRELKCRTQSALAANRPEPDEAQLRKEFQREEERRVRAALWSTHEAVNKGAKVFGDWLLTLRGGLDHRLTAEPDLTDDDIDKEWNALKTSANEKNQAEPSHEDAQRSAERKRTERIRHKRILLALSWLSVEDAHGAPRDEALIVAKGTDSTDTRERKLGDALAAILQACDVEDAERRSWLADCLPSLAARIRDDADGAVWVNRSRAFDIAQERIGLSISSKDLWDLLEWFFDSPSSYLAPTQDDQEENPTNVARDKAKDSVKKAGKWLSLRFGEEEGADFNRVADMYQRITDWASATSPGLPVAVAIQALAHTLKVSPTVEDVFSAVSYTGSKRQGRFFSAFSTFASQATSDSESIQAVLAAAKESETRFREQGQRRTDNPKGHRPYSDAIVADVERACGITYLYASGRARHPELSVVLGHAARRISQTHSWIKRAEDERRQFETDAKRLEKVPQNALQWLCKYREERTATSGSLGEYHIRKRAIDGWDKIVQAWAALGPNSTRQQRIEAARNVQANLDDNDKFGDIQLFAGFGDEDDPEPKSCLADDEALCVWKQDGTPTAQPLKDFIAATEAQAKKKRFKVPAYRHPDPLRHPIFTDFGNSQWGINFSAHRAPERLCDVQQRVEKLKVMLADAERKLASAGERQREARQSKVVEYRDKLHRAEEELAELRETHRLTMGLWNGQTVTPVPLCWSCKRLVADLLHSSPDANGVSRADRLGRAAGNADRTNDVTITGLFEQDHWNGRLQAPRAQLDAIARYLNKHGWDATARKLIDRVRWLVTFSAQLAPQGPWTELATRLSLKPDPQYWPHAEENKKRQGHARLLLSRLPGLRVLSVDLGHRYAAACAVWEALAPETMKTEIHGHTIAAGGSGPDDLYCHTRHTDSRRKERTTIYRRIGSDRLSDGSAHPAPWARLDRQFLIKLQGEDRTTRTASTDEIKAIDQFEDWVGRKRSGDNPPRNLSVDSLMSDTVRTARLALARHGRRAKIGYQLTATARTLSGAHLQELDEAGRLELLLDTLSDWHALATDSRWSDEAARQLWNSRLAALVAGFTIEPPQQPAQTQVQTTKAQRRQAEQALRAKLQPLAQTLASDETLRRELHQAWCARWSADDDQWKQKLKWLSRWLMPRQLSRMIEVTKKDGSRVKRREPIRQAIAAASNVGGLSLTRIATLTEFRRKVQVGYFTRMRRDGSRAEIGPGFGQSTLDTLERMKEQRIKQLVSRIVEAALGIGIEQDPVWDDVKKKWREHKRPYQRSSDPRFAPCHAVIIEDLSHYRPEETRTRRENRATMDWKSAETRKRLEDHCQLYGLHLRDVNPQYTSRQDSRTGVPGIRCVDVSVADFLTIPWWRKQVARAQKRAGENKQDARDRYLLALEAKWSVASDDDKAQATPLRIPLAGGELFVAADARSPSTQGIQADLNAAANIGLRALLDPDWPGRWWYVPAILAEDGYRVPNPDKCSGAHCLQGWRVAKDSDGYTVRGAPIQLADDQDVKQAQTDCDQAESALKAARNDLKNANKGKIGLSVDEATRKVEEADAARKTAKSRLSDVKRAAKAKFYINLWRDPSAAPLSTGSWMEYGEYENRARYRVLQILRRSAGLLREDTRNAPAFS